VVIQYILPGNNIIELGMDTIKVSNEDLWYGLRRERRKFKEM